jgi:hypothetical protein
MNRKFSFVDTIHSLHLKKWSIGKVENFSWSWFHRENKGILKCSQASLHSTNTKQGKGQKLHDNDLIVLSAFILSYSCDFPISTFWNQRDH